MYVEEDGKRRALRTIGSKNIAAYKNIEVETGSVTKIYEWIREKNLSFNEI